MKLFISSSYTEFSAERLEIKEYLNQLPFGEKLETLLFDELPLYGKPIQESFHEVIESCDAVVLLIGNRLGFLDADDNQSALMHEYETAKQLGKPLLIFIKNSKNSIKDDQTRAFIDKISTEMIYSTFSDTSELKRLLYSSLLELFKPGESNIRHEAKEPSALEIEVLFPEDATDDDIAKVLNDLVLKADRSHREFGGHGLKIRDLNVVSLTPNMVPA